MDHLLTLEYTYEDLSMDEIVDWEIYEEIARGEMEGSYQPLCEYDKTWEDEDLLGAYQADKEDDIGNGG